MDQGVGLAEVVVLGVKGLSGTNELAVGLPGDLRPGTVAGGVVATVGVRGVGRGRAGMLVGHLAVEGVLIRRDGRTVHGKLLVVDAQTVAGGIVVGEGAAQQHTVGREAGALDGVGRGEGRLLDLGEEVLRVAVQGEPADGVQRIVLVWPHLGDVEGIKAVVLGIVVGHQLHLDGPRRVVAVSNVIEQILAVEVRVIPDDGLGLVGGHGVDALVADEVVLHPGDLPLGVHPRVGVRGVAVHGAVAERNASRAHEVGDLVGRLRGEAPVVVHHVGAAQARVWQALL